MTRTVFAALALLLAAVLNSQPASAQAGERIVDFHSEIFINPDASMTVRETITVDSARRRIRRGIFRDFPTSYKTPSGGRIVVGFELQEVLRDNKREPFHTEPQSNGIRIYIGDANVVIPVGRHVYRLTYRTQRQLGFFDDFDELFWNVTGNGWEFPIEQARATVHLPAGANVLNRAGYTGVEGEQGQDFTYTAQTGQTLTVETDRTLEPLEGLTIAVSWPPGFVERPSNEQKIGYFLSDNSVAIIGVLGLALLLAYYLMVWTKVGRDPETGAIFPLYTPPNGLSPAGARYVSRMSFDDKAFTAAIVSLAVKGFLTITEGSKKNYTLERTGQSARLSKGEAAIVLKLFPGSSKKIELEQENHKILQSAKSELRKTLRTEFEKVYFVHNTRYFLPGIGLTVLALLLMAAASDQPAITALISVGLAGWIVTMYYLFRRMRSGRLSILAVGGFLTHIGVVLVTLFSLAFFSSDLTGGAFYTGAATIGAAVIVGLIQLLNALFYHLLKAPTRLGRRAMDSIEGFKDYLSVAEKDRMNLLNPPEKTPELFEKFLPYALALGVEQQWSEQFSDVLARAASDPTASDRYYTPSWYSGRSFDGGIGSFASSLGSGFSGAISAASTAPGSSSGSGGGGFSGGGFSGGGGGGGGGGGW